MVPRLTLRARAEHLLYCIFLLLVYAKIVLVFDLYPAFGVITPFGLVGRLPSLWTFIAFVLVGVVFDRELDIRVVGVALTLLVVP